MGYRYATYWERRGVPYVKTRLPLGITWTVFLRRATFHDHCEFIYNYDPDVRYIGLLDFGTPAVLIRDPELIKEVAIKSFGHFPDHRSFVTEDMDPIFGRNVFSLRGDQWREMRNTLSPSFTANKMKFLFDLVAECSHDFVGYLHANPGLCSMIELKDTFTRYTNDVIATSAFGISVNSMKDPKNEFYERGIDVSRFSGTLRLMKFMLLRACPRLMRMAGFTFLSPASSKFFSKVISETVQAREEQGIVRPDMIHLLLQARDTREPGAQMAIDDIVAQAFIFFLAGFDTVSTLMCYVVYELALHQDVQQRLREEVDCYLAERNGKISYESLSKMEYMEMVVSEVLRLHPPSLITDRLCLEKFNLPPAGPGYKGVTVNPNDGLLFPIYSLHRDPKYFPDPEKFDPERFNEENKAKVNPYVYIPFGVGPRKCIGNRFALMETKILMVHLLHKFLIKPNKRTSIPPVYKKGTFTLVPEDGLWITLEKRED
ncbi:Cytochrome P450 9e2 [Habropoda laboriosa]|uniref:Cytochrome P450 9e2 n=1 Tax=Habropoda laboriosa TaxID=597456 RepID=A0A0L7QR50_9HYME|nr:Cytochrome P450 9e2 [Habropoda laboriosa]